MKELWKVTKQWAFLVFTMAFMLIATITMPIWSLIKGSFKVANRMVEWFDEKGKSLGIS